jgi:exopolysaccharide biosynthesis protein
VSAGWQTLAPGLEVRTYYPAEMRFAELRVLRIDPAHFTLRAHYLPGAPLSALDWQRALPDAAAFVNANFFDLYHNILGLLVADGVAYGSAYTDRGGTLLVQNGQPRIRSNIAEPHYPGETLEQAVQGFPMLVLDGAPAFTSAQRDRATRRTAAGQDGSGRILLLTTPLLGLTLADLSAFLAASDMDLRMAFNLDGGGSSLMMHTGDPAYLMPSIDPVPAVLAVYPR